MSKCMLDLKCSLVNKVMSALGGFCRNSWVRSNACNWLAECIAMSGCELLFVVWAAVANNNLRGVFVWHHDGWAWKSTSVSIWVVRLKWFFDHTCMQVLSNLIGSLINGSSLRWFVSLGITWSCINWTWESDTHVLSILHEHGWPRCHSCIFKVSIWLGHLGFVKHLCFHHVLHGLSLKLLWASALSHHSYCLYHFLYEFNYCNFW